MARCMCVGCFNEGTHKLSLDKRGGRAAYMCDWHFAHNEYYGAGGRNEAGAVDKFRTVDKKCGIELETSFTSEKARIELLGAGFTPTNDCSLDGDFTCEYVSPLYHGMNSIVRYVKTIDKYMQSDDIEINESCGTHFHFSINNMRTSSGVNACEIMRVDEFYRALFTPVSDAMAADTEKTARVFGRYFSLHYASRITSRTDSEDRYNWINVTNSNNIEFRLFRFRSAAQYTVCMKFAEAVTTSIMRNFETFPQMTYSEKLHKCNVVGQKIKKMFEKIDF